MMIFLNMKQNPVTKHLCEFCGKSFVKETTIIKHLCEPKRRWQERDKHGSRIAYTSWIQFYSKHTNKKQKEYSDFIESAYYTAFVRFGNYCVEAQVLNVPRYVDWLLKNQISIDKWHKDTNYTKFIIDYLKTEDPLDAIARSIETTVNLAKEDKIQTKDVLRYGNRNKICFEITKGKISPWMLFQSQSGLEFIESLDSTQQKMILEYINPEQWAIKFTKHKSIIPEMKELLRAGGY
jgi:hypothetical protein